MAKVFGPLHSDGATGKLANAIVFFPWKGNNVVRKWLKPTNKKSAKQGVQRCIMGGTGRACGEILPRPGNVTISNFAQALITLKLKVKPLPLIFSPSRFSFCSLVISSRSLCLDFCGIVPREVMRSAWRRRVFFTRHHRALKRETCDSLCKSPQRC
jgi:hypothetical protein